MDTGWLLRYEEEDAERALSVAGGVLKRGRLERPQDLYPELKLPHLVGYSRAPVPLPLLVLLYDVVVVYVPPSSQSRLEAKWGLPFEDFVDLARAGLVQPLIGHPPDYSAQYFKPLLEERPPSLWARGYGMLCALGLEATLSPDECPLPVSEIAQLKPARLKYSRQFPALSQDELTARIEREVLTNYADLWIFGEGELADALALHREPMTTFGALLTVNEVRTYPTLFGMGGTANYDLDTLRAEAVMLETFGAEPPRDVRVVPQNLDILLRGVGVDVGQVTANDLIELHASGGAERLRRAMSDFEHEAQDATEAAGSDLDLYLGAAETLQDRLKQVGDELLKPETKKRLGDVDRRTRYTVRAGLPALGAGLGAMLGSLPGAVAGGAIGNLAERILPDAAVDHLAERVNSKLFSPGVANLWRMSRKRHEQ
jgi:hypothetical protein